MKDLRFKRKYFLMVQSGEKTLECRVNYPDINAIKKGDQLKFFWEHLSLIVEITGIRRYLSFKEMLGKEPLQKLVPGMSADQALSEYEAIYPNWKLKKLGGITVFEFKIIRN